MFTQVKLEYFRVPGSGPLLLQRPIFVTCASELRQGELLEIPDFVRGLRLSYQYAGSDYSCIYGIGCTAYLSHDAPHPQGWEGFLRWPDGLVWFFQATPQTNVLAADFTTFAVVTAAGYPRLRLKKPT